MLWLQRVLFVNLNNNSNNNTQTSINTEAMIKCSLNPIQRNRGVLMICNSIIMIRSPNNLSTSSSMMCSISRDSMNIMRRRIRLNLTTAKRRVGRLVNNKSWTLMIRLYLRWPTRWIKMKMSSREEPTTTKIVIQNIYIF